MKRIEIAMPGKAHARPGKRGHPAVGWERQGLGPRVVVMGDSVSFGVGDTPNGAGSHGWGEHLARATDAAFFLNVSRMGARAKTLTQEQVPVVLQAKPDVALIIVGGNDILRGDFDHRSVYSHIVYTIETLREAGIHVVLFRLHDPRKTLPLPRFIRNAIGKRIDRLNNALDAAVLKTQRLSPIYIDPTHDGKAYLAQTWHIDRMHPSAEGHRWLADLALDHLGAVGITRVHPTDPAPVAQVTALSKLMWLLRHGTPWFLRRSIDLIPAAAFLILMELLTKKQYEDLTKGLT